MTFWGFWWPLLIAYLLGAVTVVGVMFYLIHSDTHSDSY